MKILILGMGHVGKALATELKSQGHTVVGTTTTPEKIAPLEAVADEVHLLKGNESEKVRQAAVGCDAIVVTVAPNVRNATTLEEREKNYADVLLESCRSAAAAYPRTVFLSSFSVYGDGGPGSDPITEATPVSNQKEPSAKYYHLSEQEVLKHDRGCVLRFPDMYGAPGDLSFPQRVRLAHEIFGGKAPFGAQVPLYAIHFEDVVAAVLHVLLNDLTGPFNVCDNENVPRTNEEVFDAICDAEGLPRLEFLDQIKAPNRAISADRIYATGYRVKHPDPNRDLFS